MSMEVWRPTPESEIPIPSVPAPLQSEPKPWQSAPREAFTHYPQPKNEQEVRIQSERTTKYRIEFRRSLERYIQGTRGGRRGESAAVLGAALGKSFIKVYQNIGDLGEPGSPFYSRNIGLLREDQNTLSRVLGANEAEAIIRGFVGEFAVANMLAHPKLINADVYFPNDQQVDPQSGLKDPGYEEGKGVDWWIDMSQENEDRPYAIALQVKTGPFLGRDRQVVFPIRNDKELSRVVLEEVNDRHLPVSYDYKRLQESIWSSGHRLIDLQNENPAQVAAAIALITTPGQDNADFHPLSGTVMKGSDVADRLWEGISNIEPLDNSEERIYH